MLFFIVKKETFIELKIKDCMSSLQLLTSFFSAYKPALPDSIQSLYFASIFTDLDALWSGILLKDTKNIFRQLQSANQYNPYLKSTFDDTVTRDTLNEYRLKSAMTTCVSAVKRSETTELFFCILNLACI